MITKVLLVTGMMNRGGAESMLMDLVRNKPRDTEINFLVNTYPTCFNNRGAFDDEIELSGCHIYHIGMQSKIGPFKYLVDFKKVVKESRPDVVHIHLNSSNGFICYAAHQAGVKKIISHCHAELCFRGSLLNRAFKETVLWAQKWLIGWYATDFWGCSDNANKRLYRGRNYDKAIIINNAISCDMYAAVTEEEVEEVRASYNVPRDAVLLGNVGRIVPHKNIAFIIPLLSELVKRGLNAYAIIIGRNDTKDYTAMVLSEAERLGVRDRIRMMGEQSNIPAIMRSFDLFVGPALREGFALVPIEAQAAATPCLLYKGFPRAEDMGAGLVEFHDDFNIREWCDSAIRLLEKRGTVSQETCLNAIRNRGFDAKQNAKLICEYYRQ